VSPGEVATEIMPRMEGRDNPKEVIKEVYAEFGYTVSNKIIIQKTFYQDNIYLHFLLLHS